MKSLTQVIMGKGGGGEKRKKKLRQLKKNQSPRDHEQLAQKACGNKIL